MLGGAGGHAGIGLTGPLGFRASTNSTAMSDILLELAEDGTEEALDSILHSLIVVLPSSQTTRVSIRVPVGVGTGRQLLFTGEG